MTNASRIAFAQRRCVFMFGSTAAEDGVDLDVFRRILRTIRVKR